MRFANVSDNPGWYTDEAAHVDIAHHLLRGEVRYMAINQSTLLFARPPLFHLLLAGWFGFVGEGIGTLRLFTAALGVLSVGTLYGVARRLSGSTGFGLLAAGLLAIYPQAVLYSRFGFSYNLLPPLILLALMSSSEYLRSGKRSWLALAALAIGLGVVSDLMALTFIPALLLIVLLRRWRDVLWGLPLTVVPFGVYAGVMFLTVPDAFLFDLGFTLGRLNALSPIGQIANVALNYSTLLSQDFWILAGVIGLFLLRPNSLKLAGLLLFWIPLILMGRTVALHSLSAYYLIPLLPLIALGAAGLLWYGIPRVYMLVSNALTEQMNGRYSRWTKIGAGVFVAGVAVVPLSISLKLTVDGVQTQYGTAIDPFLVNPLDARAVADYMNAHAHEQDVVIASPAVGWQFRANTADFQMAVAANGEDAPHLPGNIPAERWAFDPRLANADWVIVDDLWRNWGAVHIPGVARMLQTLENWPLIFEAGAIQVYRNPAFKPSQ
ncbi:MAG: glycosyltransferase family 39 protein [Anaerolineae bacterium]|nr:glycosyltransferase family 39 protein [Anaerolineae bacterium]